MPDYPLEDLSPRAFEQLTVALAQKLIGPGVEAFGSGPDGGREASWRGRIDWSNIPDCGDDAWNGYTVFQAKQRERLGAPDQNLSWLQKQIKSELDAWADPGSKRGHLPRYIVFVTNVNLGSVPSKGIDAANQYIERRLHAGTGNDGKGKSLASRGVVGWKIWHRDQLNGFLSDAADIRRAFKGLLSVGDVLAMIEAVQGNLDPDVFAPFIAEHGEAALKADRWIHFNEAGGDSRHDLSDVFIDLPAWTGEKQSRPILQEFLALSDLVLKPSLLGQMKPHRVLTGQPGGGKSTVSRFLTQVLRSAFLSDQALDTGAAEVKYKTTATLARLDLQAPTNRRWPVRVDLAEYAEALGPNGNITIQRWIARGVTERSDIEVTPVTLMRWLREWPSAVILDGFDEVTAPEVRSRVLGEIQNFIDTCASSDADLMVLITTRPTGERERIDPDRFEQADLAQLDLETAVAYGERTTRHRLADDPEKLRTVLDRFGKQAADRSMQHLLKTPLQVMIVTIILEKYASLPGDRYRLFWQYFGTIYSREAAKLTSLAPLLQSHEGVIREIHEIVGLSLHVSGESASDARVAMSEESFRAAILSRLKQVGHDEGPTANHLTDRLVEATTKRLVLLVPGEGGGVSFEIRSLQELMAARALTQADRPDVRQNLHATARSPHWRNVWIFAAGRIFADRSDGYRDDLLDVIESVDSEVDWPRWLVAVGPELAGALMGDGCAMSTPKWQRRLVEVALLCLHGPLPSGPAVIGSGLAVAAREDRTTKTNIRNALRAAAFGIPIQRDIARRLLKNEGLRDLGPRIPSQMPTSSSGRSKDGRLLSVGELLSGHIDSLQLSGDRRKAVESVVSELTELRIIVGIDGLQNRWGWHYIDNLLRTKQALRDPELQLILGALFGSLDPVEEWFVQHAFATIVRDDLLREPVAARLRGVTIIPVG